MACSTTWPTFESAGDRTPGSGVSSVRHPLRTREPGGVGLHARRAPERARARRPLPRARLVGMAAAVRRGGGLSSRSHRRDRAMARQLDLRADGGGDRARRVPGALVRLRRRAGVRDRHAARDPAAGVAGLARAPGDHSSGRHARTPGRPAPRRSARAAALGRARPRRRTLRALTHRPGTGGTRAPDQARTLSPAAIEGSVSDTARSEDGGPKTRRRPGLDCRSCSTRRRPPDPLARHRT